MECRELQELPYDLEYKSIVDAIREKQVRRIVIQAPDGLKQASLAIALCIKRELGENIEIYLSGEGVFGSCDLDIDVLQATIRPDLIVHIGHTPYPPELCSRSVREKVSETEVLYIPAFSNLEVSRERVSEALSILSQYEAKRVGLVATIQHAKRLEYLASLLRDSGFEPVIPRGSPPYLLNGQVIGCDYRVARGVDVDAFIYLGGGLFHPIGLYLAVGKPVIKIDPYEDKTLDVTPLGIKYLKIRLFKIEKAMTARRWALIAGLKTCQYRDWIIESLGRLIKSKGGEYIVILTSTLNLERLASVDSPWIEAFVVTSCPRLPIDDLWEYHKPVLTPGEAKMALTGRIDEYLMLW